MLYGQHGPRQFGKICQKLLAVAFRAGGCDHLVERGVQGVDIDAAWGGIKYTTEVKTTTTAAIHLAAKDITGLRSRQADGYHPLLGVLRLAPLADWLVADAATLRVGTLPVDLLRPYRLRDLELQLQPLFDGVLEAHFEPTLRAGQYYLDQTLAALGVILCE